MLMPPHVRARRRFLRRYLGPIVASVIVAAGASVYFGPPSRPAAAQTLSFTP
jgi:hypothetical protein